MVRRLCLASHFVILYIPNNDRENCIHPHKSIPPLFSCIMHAWELIKRLVLLFSNSRYGYASWRGHNLRHQMCSSNYHMISGTSLTSDSNSRLVINNEIQQAGNSNSRLIISNEIQWRAKSSPFKIPETLGRADLSMRDQIGSLNSSTPTGPSFMRLREQTQQVQKRKNPEPSGVLDLDLSLGVKTKLDTINHEEADNNGAVESNLRLSLNSLSNPLSKNYITTLKGIDAYGEEEEGSEIMRTEKIRTSGLDLTLWMGTSWKVRSWSGTCLWQRFQWTHFPIMCTTYDHYIIKVTLLLLLLFLLLGASSDLLSLSTVSCVSWAGGNLRLSQLHHVIKKMLI